MNPPNENTTSAEGSERSLHSSYLEIVRMQMLMSPCSLSCTSEPLSNSYRNP